jgi:hypothetical protein
MTAHFIGDASSDSTESDDDRTAGKALVTIVDVFYKRHSAVKTWVFGTKTRLQAMHNDDLYLS